MVLIHGLGEHSGRYLWFAEQFVRAGFAILTIDLRGHGLTGGQRGHVPNYECFMDDIELLLGEAQKRYPGLPLFLYGHSLGGNLVINYVLRRKPKLAGVIASAPGLKTAEKPAAWKTTIGRLLYRVYPKLSMENGLKVNFLSHDPEVIRKYQTDPLVHKLISARFGIDFLDSGVWALAHAGEFSLPLLIIQGGQDGIVDPGTNRQFAKDVPGDVTYREWETGYHELHNEEWRNEVTQVILDWAGLRVPLR
jgi:alpha-beta hydrolase superfamily lysophospholipase